MTAATDAQIEGYLAYPTLPKSLVLSLVERVAEESEKRELAESRLEFYDSSDCSAIDFAIYIDSLYDQIERYKRPDHNEEFDKMAESLQEAISENKLLSMRIDQLEEICRQNDISVDNIPHPSECIEKEDVQSSGYGQFIRND